MKIRVIGCGGIAGRLLDTLCRFLNYHPDFQDTEITEKKLLDAIAHVGVD